MDLNEKSSIMMPPKKLYKMSLIQGGKYVDLQMMVVSDHPGDKETWHSRTIFLIYMNMELITWFSKKQQTIGSSVFGDYFVAIKTGI